MRGWVEQNLGPLGRLQDARRGVLALGRFAADLPATLVRAENVMRVMERIGAEGLDITDASLRAIETTQSRAFRMGHWALWAIVAALALLWWR